ncbi:ER membrane protein DP1/Yop1 [Schizosaccharomyces japonicus yFS275]|uniref:Protein YOP1 n=1 Tax=Schizosaccharomyces japonicus (strain yFS275 / FY16936) TaxID=402676 RepID=B6K529_SCHJY|nr:ER membrane protein DP1/Yop1 [Schizosaccharomyces japonicus yFS275]EEB08633.2 ER membrane protein DP1/Yop1 [Schizosaccharomyces japonicus yFS275]
MSYQQRIQQQLNVLDKRLSAFPVLNVMEQKVGVNKVYICLGLATVYFALLFLNFGGYLLTNTLAFVMPAFFSIYSLETPDKDDDTQWLTYYLITSFMTVLEYWIDFLLVWVPFYWLMKAIFLVWLALPRFSGASLIYRAIIRPYITPYVMRVMSRVNNAAAAGAPVPPPRSEKPAAAPAAAPAASATGAQL